MSHRTAGLVSDALRVLLLHLIRLSKNCVSERGSCTIWWSPKTRENAIDMILYVWISILPLPLSLKHHKTPLLSQTAVNGWLTHFVIHRLENEPPDLRRMSLKDNTNTPHSRAQQCLGLLSVFLNIFLHLLVLTYLLHIYRHEHKRGAI